MKKRTLVSLLMLGSVTPLVWSMEPKVGEREAYLGAILQQAQVLEQLLIDFQLSASLPKDSRLREWVNHAAHAVAEIDAVAGDVLEGKTMTQFDRQLDKYRERLAASEAADAVRLEEYKKLRDDLKSPS